MFQGTPLEAWRTRVAARPGLALLAGGVAFLLVDLIVKLIGFSLFIGPFKLLGGNADVELLITYLWDGTVVGLGLGLAGIGLSMTYSILRFANFAHGDYVTGGAFAGWGVAWLVAGFQTGRLEGNVGYLLTLGAAPDGPSAADLSVSVFGNPLAVVLGLVVAALATVVLTLGIDRVVFRPMRDAGGISLLIASIGVALAVRYLIVLVYGGTNRGLTANTTTLILSGVNGKLAIATKRSTLVFAQQGDVPPGRFYHELPWLQLGGYSKEIISITTTEVGLVIMAVALMYGLHLLLQRTKLGKAMRATADNRDLARITGIPTERVVRATWIIGGGLAGASGYLIALEQGTVAFDLGWLLLLLIFAAVIVGGIGSIYGAMVGGLIIGLTNNVSLIWIPSSLATAASFAVMIAVLIVKPDGLFGGITTA